MRTTLALLLGFFRSFVTLGPELKNLPNFGPFFKRQASLPIDVWNVQPVTLLEIVLRTTIVYVVLVAGIRLSGKRQIGQMTPFDLVVLLLLSNAVQNAMTGPDTSVPGGIVAAVTLLVLNHLVSKLRMAHPTLRWLVVGMPVTLVQNGNIQFQSLEHEQMTEEDLMANLREHQCTALNEVALATLEVDGEVSVVCNPSSGAHAFVKTKKKLVRHHKK